LAYEISTTRMPRTNRLLDGQQVAAGGRGERRSSSAAGVAGGRDQGAVEKQATAAMSSATIGCTVVI
jgi:hypothetical protein